MSALPLKQSRIAMLALAVATAGVFGSYPLAAQIKNPIQAAKDAIKNSQQQQQQQRGQKPAATPTTTPASSAAAAPGPVGDCCTPDKLQQLAGIFGKLDIVGVKLGMTADEAVAAIKASNPKLKIEILDQEMEVAGKKVRIHRWVLGHTASSPFDGSQEVVAFELTPPPNTQVVALLARYVGFASSAPVAVSNLRDALYKKYGSNPSEALAAIAWVFDSTGKQVTGELSNEVRGCVPVAGQGFPLELRGVGDLNPAATYGGYLSLNNSVATGPNTAANCAPYTVVTADVYSKLPGNEQMNHLWVTMQSDTLQYNSLVNTHAYLQKAIDDLQKQQEDAAKQRTAPKL